MANFKFTGANIAAAVLILAYFFPWFSAMGISSMSGFSITTNGIAPGMLSMFLGALDRFLMILIILIPLSGALILYQNVTGNKKYNKYYKAAHMIPAIMLVLGVVILYFKMKPDMPEFSKEDYGGLNEAMRGMSKSMRDMAPGIFDVLGFGIYLSLAASIYLFLVSIGKIKDKEYFNAPSNVVKQETGNPADKEKSE